MLISFVPLNLPVYSGLRYNVCIGFVGLLKRCSILGTFKMVMKCFYSFSVSTFKYDDLYVKKDF
ncbi:hypothetical protein Lalb_Chr09g0321461 [Lupinus albus]|uniref:Uncharacterized protein n=1 Tax=Lupinus albus TaxID=3870 RepID=A0A6A4PYX7_LUPAL|nr:hypothetical protein Lalb_Chr09g0321461 [Lupinus albus]